MINRNGKKRVYSPKHCWNDLTNSEIDSIVKKNGKKYRVWHDEYNIDADENGNVWELIDED